MIPIFEIQSINIHPVSKRNITSFVVGKQRAPEFSMTHDQVGHSTLHLQCPKVSDHLKKYNPRGSSGKCIMYVEYPN